MKVTPKQSNVLENLHRIVMRRMTNGKLAPYLDGEDCRMQINSLAANKMIVLVAGQKTEGFGHLVGFGYRWEKAAT